MLVEWLQWSFPGIEEKERILLLPSPWIKAAGKNSPVPSIRGRGDLQRNHTPTHTPHPQDASRNSLRFETWSSSEQQERNSWRARRGGVLDPGRGWGAKFPQIPVEPLGVGCLSVSPRLRGAPSSLPRSAFRQSRGLRCHYWRSVGCGSLASGIAPASAAPGLLGLTYLSGRARRCAGRREFSPGFWAPFLACPHPRSRAPGAGPQAGRPGRPRSPGREWRERGGALAPPAGAGAAAARGAGGGER